MNIYYFLLLISPILGGLLLYIIIIRWTNTMISNVVQLRLEGKGPDDLERVISKIGEVFSYYFWIIALQILLITGASLISMVSEKNERMVRDGLINHKYIEEQLKLDIIKQLNLK